MVSFRQPRNERHGFFLTGPIEKAHHFGACQYTIQSRKNKFVYQETKRTEARIKSFSRRETPPPPKCFTHLAASEGESWRSAPRTLC